MWLIRDFELRDCTLDTGSEDLAPIPTLAVYVDDVCIINSITHCDFSTDPCQLLICNCGQPGCNSGGYVSFRRVDDSVVILPSFQLFVCGDDFERNQYKPPDYLNEDRGGAAVFDARVYSALHARFSALPVVSKLPSLSANEAMALIQIQAPLQVMGRFPYPATLNRNLILAVTEGEIEIETRAVNSFVENVRGTDAQLTVAPRFDCWSPIEFHLDGPGFPAWKSFARFDGRIGIMFEPFGVLTVKE